MARLPRIWIPVINEQTKNKMVVFKAKSTANRGQVESLGTKPRFRTKGPTSQLTKCTNIAAITAVVQLSIIRPLVKRETLSNKRAVANTTVRNHNIII